MEHWLKKYSFSKIFTSTIIFENIIYFGLDTRKCSKYTYKTIITVVTVVIVVTVAIVVSSNKLFAVK